MLKFTIEYAGIAKPCNWFHDGSVAEYQTNNCWDNYFIGEGFAWDEVYFDSEKEALDMFWSIKNEYDMNWEDVSSTLGMSIYNNGNLTILGQDSLNEDSEPNIYCYRVIQTDEYIEKLEWVNDLKK
jgi:hypothetical protein